MDHIPVLSDKVLEIFGLEKGDVVVDGTLGLGGHAAQFLKEIGTEGRLIGIEADQENLEIARQNLVSYENKVIYFHRNFENLAEVLAETSYNEVDAVFFDLGLSSPQVDEAERGFSFLRDGPLDMRFDRTEGKTAADLVNCLRETELEQIFREYGEERYARKIVNAIVDRRKRESFKTTFELAQLIEEVKPSERRGRYTARKHKHPATQVFQALRIAVNQELEVLKIGLEQGFEALRGGGRMIVISYHSLEDRIVKNFFRDKAKECICPMEILRCECHHQPELKKLNKKPIQPAEEEINRNPRSRSAKLRAVEKL